MESQFRRYRENSPYAEKPITNVISFYLLQEYTAFLFGLNTPPKDRIFPINIQ